MHTLTFVRANRWMRTLQEVAETMEKQGLKEEAIEFYTQVYNLAGQQLPRWHRHIVPVGEIVSQRVGVCGAGRRPLCGRGANVRGKQMPVEGKTSNV